MIRLVVSDIDGTLVPEGCTALNPEYFEVIRALADHGVRFAAASGRQKTSVDAVFHELSHMIYYVSDNGGYIQKNGIPMKEIYLERNDLEEFLKEARELDGCRVLLSTLEGYYTDDQDEAFHKLVFEQYKGSGGVTNDLSLYTDRCIKVSLYGDYGSGKLKEQLYSRWKDRFAINISGERWLDVNSLDANKGAAVEYIQKELGITPAETMVFGDNFNDISMLKCGGRSYAPASSAPEVRAAAGYEVAPYEEDGVLQVLKQLLEEIRDEK